MKKILTILPILFSLNFYSQWMQQVSGTTEALNDVYCVTPELVFVVGDNGTILKTTDGGENWVQKNCGTNLNLIKVQFIGNQIGFAFGFNPSSSLSGTLFKTINGGESWTPIITSISYYQNSPFSYYGFYCINENTFYFTDSGLIKKTINGGVTVESLNIGGEKIQFINEQIGYVTNGYNLVKTIDGGISWNIIQNDVTAFYFINENIGFVYSLTGMNKTINGGIAYSNLGAFNIGLNKIYAPTDNVIWGTPVECLLNGSPCYGIRGEILNDGTFQTDTCQAFRSFCFANPTNGYAIGQGGDGIYKNSTGNMGISGVKSKQSLVIYPNPASEQLNITFNEKSNEPFTIEIADFLGKTVYSQTNQASNSVSIDTKMFSKGVYFLKVIRKEKREMQKVIIN